MAQLKAAAGWAAMLASGALLAQTAAGPLVTPVSKTEKTYTDMKAADAGASAPPQVTVDKAANRITVNGMSARLNVHAGPEDNMMSFEVMGLLNPEIVVHSGATLTINLVNYDDDMNHNLVVTKATAPFAPQPTLGPDAVSSSSIKPHDKGEPLHGEVLVLHVDGPGSGSYVCSVQNHAKNGMHGNFTVVK